MSWRELRILGALLPLAVVTSGCNQSVPDEVVSKDKKKDDRDYNYHKRYPWGQGSEPVESSGSSESSHHSSSGSKHH